MQPEMVGSFTKGPWEIQEPMDHELWIVEAGKQSFEWRVIAGLPWPDEKSDIPRKQVEANARLIATAPKILAALAEISGLVGDAFNGQIGATQALDAIDDIAKAAITAALGGYHG